MTTLQVLIVLRIVISFVHGKKLKVCWNALTLRLIQMLNKEIITKWLSIVLWGGIKWIIPVLVVVVAIRFGIEWGDLFHEESELVRGLVSWFAIWAAINFYGWARREW